MPGESGRGPDPKAEIVEVGANDAGQRIDNFLIKLLKGVPKTRLYRALRSGEVRVNGARKKPPYQLCAGDLLRIPPLRRSGAQPRPPVSESLLEKIPVLFDDRDVLVVHKPAGLAAHGGTGMAFGLIEALRHLRPDLPYLELAHRLDRETSGCLMLAKSRAALLALQAQLGRERSIEKDYLALVKGAWPHGRREVGLALSKRASGGLPAADDPQKHPESAHRPARKLKARSVFSPRQNFETCALLEIRLLTGRKHQARIHAAGIGRPIAGDRMYGDPEFNRRMKKAGLKRLFLHAERLRFAHPRSGKPVETRAELPDALHAVLEHLRAAG